MRGQRASLQALCIASSSAPVIQARCWSDDSVRFVLFTARNRPVPDSAHPGERHDDPAEDHRNPVDEEHRYCGDIEQRITRVPRTGA